MAEIDLPEAVYITLNRAFYDKLVEVAKSKEARDALVDQFNRSFGFAERQYRASLKELQEISSFLDQDPEIAFEYLKYVEEQLGIIIADELTKDLKQA